MQHDGVKQDTCFAPLGSSQVDFLCVPIWHARKCSQVCVVRPSGCVMLESDHMAIMAKVKLRSATNVRRE
eukprot:8260470-Alexandrium_andersonii.AAC.1